MNIFQFCIPYTEINRWLKYNLILDHDHEVFKNKCFNILHFICILYARIFILRPLIYGSYVGLWAHHCKSGAEFCQRQQ